MILPTLAALVLSSFSPIGPSRPDQGLDEARARFSQTAVTGTLEQKKAALQSLVALGDPAAAPTIATEYGRTAQELRKQREGLLKTRYALDRRRVMLENLKLQSQHDPSVAKLIPQQEGKIAELDSERSKAERTIGELEPWRDAIVDGLTGLVQKLDASRRTKVEQEIRKDAEENPDTLLRAVSIELVGRVGGPGTSTTIHEWMCESESQITKLRQRISKAMSDVRKMEKRLQEETAKQGGQISQASVQQYNDVKKEASDATTQVYALEILVEACQRAGGAALARESGKDLEKSMQKLVAALKKGKDASRIDTLELLFCAGTDDVRAHARTLLAAETEPLGVAPLVDGLAALHDTSVAPDLISKYLVHESWHVRSRSAAALARLRSRDAIPALIARLDAEQGRLRSDVNDALVSLTGQDFRPNSAVWQRWWKENSGTFQVPPAPPEKTALEEAKEASGVTFFGISTESQRVVFVLDLSGSMNFAMVPKNNPDDDTTGGRQPDMPGAGESSRLEVAKRDLAKALGGVKDKGVFNLVLFASDVWTWSESLVEMNPKVRGEVTSYVEKVEAVGGTNLYGALERAFDLAGATGKGGEWSKPVIDTIYFLTDGRASVGVTTDPDEILAYVRERNANAGITIHTIGLSDAHDAVLLRRMAEENGGQYVGR
jgi:HEAT repeat protein